MNHWRRDGVLFWVIVAAHIKHKHRPKCLLFVNNWFVNRTEWLDR